MTFKNSDDYQRRDYNVAIYCRLSNDDGENKESNSIANQKSILVDYVHQRSLNIYDVYIDDGYTGTNFDRPDFKRLIKDIENNKVDLIITKDMSRLGRDYIEVGYYLERYFPEKGVGYIALNDNIDTTKDLDGNEITPFKALINDMYSKDISKKIRSVFDYKRREGKFIGAFAPYGYRKDPEDKNKLIIDHETAPIVRRIYSMYLSGEGFTSIARKLNGEGIYTPAINKEKRLENYRNGRLKVPKWSHSSVKHILTNSSYTGDLAQRKSKKISYKSQKVKRLGKGDWIIARDTHEGIITREEFNLVAKLMEQKKPEFGVAKRNTKLFSGYVYCGDCKQHMTYYKMPKGYYFLICSTYKNYGKAECTRHSILEEDLEKVILKDIVNIFNSSANDGEVRKRAEKIIDLVDKEKGCVRKELTLIERRLEDIKNPLKSLYEDRVKGIISPEQLRELFEDFQEERAILIKKKEKTEAKLKEFLGKKDTRINELVKSIYSLNKLNRSILGELIDKIELFQDGKIEIYYKIKRPNSL